MNCVDCNEKVDEETQFVIMTGCKSRSIVYPCSKCGRLHWPDGKGLENRGGKKMYSVNDKLAFLQDDGTKKII